MLPTGWRLDLFASRRALQFGVSHRRSQAALLLRQFGRSGVMIALYHCIETEQKDDPTSSTAVAIAPLVLSDGSSAQ